MDLKQKTLIELKAIAYDTIAQYEQARIALEEINKEINARHQANAQQDEKRNDNNENE